ncbi:MAG: class I SAM-dependent rRNA methyltransferase [Chitinophagales bacterium]|nr:class I SAM-dependent rRNA methyltransferase [Chitinophagales bacterium]MDW8394471.1 class I SAM-dependent rRNA methyltransferase [Chitinophagales bacterium]
MHDQVVRLRKKRLPRLRGNHPWIYDNELEPRSLEHITPGAIVTVVDHHDRFVGKGYVNPRSRIAVRLLTRDARQNMDKEFFRTKLLACLKYRKQVGYEGSYRLVHGEGDELPGLIIDRFADVFVIQTLTLGMDQWKDTIVQLLNEMFEPRGIYERNDVPVRTLEGLPLNRGFLSEPFDPLVPISLTDASFLVDVAQGQKTGFYLDQRENRLALKNLCSGAEVLDCFCHTGAFSIYAACYGASSVLACDTSEQSLAMGRRNAELNGCQHCVEFLESNAFDLLPRLVREGRRFDLIVLDPPAFTKNRQGLSRAVAGYREINLRALKLLRPGGFLFTFSCSHFMHEDLFRQTVAEAAADAGCLIRQVQRLEQAKDHPVLWHVPETQYLKGLVLQTLS